MRDGILLAALAAFTWGCGSSDGDGAGDGNATTDGGPIDVGTDDSGPALDSGGEVDAGTDPDAQPPIGDDHCADGRLNEDEVEVDCGGNTCRSCTFQAAFATIDGVTNVDVPSGYNLIELTGTIDAGALTVAIPVEPAADQFQYRSTFVPCVPGSGFVLELLDQDGRSLSSPAVGFCLGGDGPPADPTVVPLLDPLPDSIQAVWRTELSIGLKLELGLRALRPAGARCYPDDPGHACLDDFRCLAESGAPFGHCLGAICGDGVIEGDEDCDDGALDAGDGCSETCLVEDPFEPDGLANPRAYEAGTPLRLGGQDDDWYRFDLDVASDVAIWIDTPGECPSVLVSIYDEVGRQAVTFRSSRLCTTGIGPNDEAGLRDLPAGPILVRLLNPGRAGIIEGQLRIEAVARLPEGADCFESISRCEGGCGEDDRCVASQCGDEILDPGETCDGGPFDELCVACEAVLARVDAAREITTRFQPGVQHTIHIETGGVSAKIGLFIQGLEGCEGVKNITLIDSDADAVPLRALDAQCAFFETPVWVDDQFTLTITALDGALGRESFITVGSIDPAIQAGRACPRVDDRLVYALPGVQTCMPQLECAPTDEVGVGLCEDPTEHQGARHGSVEAAADVGLSEVVEGGVPGTETFITLNLDASTSVSWSQLDCPSEPLELYALTEAFERGPLLATRSFINCGPTDLGELDAGAHAFVWVGEPGADFRAAFVPTRAVDERCDVLGLYGECVEAARCRAEDESADGTCAAR